MTKEVLVVGYYSIETDNQLGIELQTAVQAKEYINIQRIVQLIEEEAIISDIIVTDRKGYDDAEFIPLFPQQYSTIHGLNIYKIRLAHDYTISLNYCEDILCRLRLRDNVLEFSHNVKANLKKVRAMLLREENNRKVLLANTVVKATELLNSGFKRIAIWDEGNICKRPAPFSSLAELDSIQQRCEPYVSTYRQYTDETINLQDVSDGTWFYEVEEYQGECTTQLKTISDIDLI